MDLQRFGNGHLGKGVNILLIKEYLILTFNHFNSYSTKARILALQNRLIELGYDTVIVSGKRDKPTIKALQDFQKKNGITPNAVVDKYTFELLDINM